MTKNQPLSDEMKETLRLDVAEARKNGKPTLKEIAAKYGIHPTMISKIAPPNGTTRTVKAAPKKAKRKVAKPTSKPEKVTIESLAREYLQHREAMLKASAKIQEMLQED